MKSNITTGYDGVEKEEPLIVHWNLIRDTSPIYSGVQAYVKAGSEVRGVIRLKNEEEFKWLKQKISGDFRRETSRS